MTLSTIEYYLMDKEIFNKVSGDKRKDLNLRFLNF